MIFELVATAPSRAGKRELRRDYCDNLGRFTNALRRRSIVSKSPRFFCTWDQLAVACGYDDVKDTNHGTPRFRRTLKNYTEVLEEVGLVRVQGQHGAGGGLWVELTRPAELDSASCARSSAG